MTGWRDDAACRDVDPELFFPLGEETASPLVLAERTREAREHCVRCPVQRQCLEWALSDAGPRYGVAGGLDSHDRRLLRRHRTTTP